MSNSLITPWTAECQASLSFTVSQILLKLMSIESMMPSNHLVLSQPLLIITSIYLRFKVFSNESALPIRRPKYWSFSFSISSANEYSVLISFRTDWSLMSKAYNIQIFDLEILFSFCFLLPTPPSATPLSWQDPSSPIRDQTQPQQWQHQVLTCGPPGNSQYLLIFI